MLVPRSLLPALLCGAALQLCCGAQTPAGAVNPRTVAVIGSEDSWYTEPLRSELTRSIQDISGRRASVISASTVGEKTGDQALRAAIEGALSDPSIHYVLVTDGRAAAIAGDSALPLNKPVIGAALIDPDLVPLPIDKSGRSLKSNYAVVSVAVRTADLLKEMRAAIPFASIQLLVDEQFAAPGASLEAWRERCAKELGCEVRLVRLGLDVDATVKAIDSAAGPVCLLPTARLSTEAHAALLQGLTARRIPVYSFAGRTEVEQGALIGLLPESRTQLARRAAVAFDQISSGVAVSELVLRVQPSLELFLNETTASRIGVSPRIDVLNRATLVSPYETESGQSLSFGAALVTALDQNPTLKAQLAATKASWHDVGRATGALLPQVAAVAEYQQIDNDRAQASGGLYLEKSLFVGLGLSQTLFDDEAITRVRVAREALKVANANERVRRLDIAASAAHAYLQFLSARAALRVTEENARTTQKHLELANLRQRVGTSGPEDIYRFESLSAQQRAETTAARMQVERARTALNQALGVAPATQWSPRDTSLDDPAFASFAQPLIRLVDDRSRLDRLRAYFVGYAANHSPDIEAAVRSVGAQRLTAEQKARRSFLPKAEATANVGRLAQRDAGGPTLADQLGGAGLSSRSSEPDREVWTVGVNVSLPLFTGGSMTADTRKARAQLRQMEHTREAVQDAVLAETQASLYSVVESYDNIALSAKSADLAERNLAVIQRKYEQGTVSIVTLLEAQTAAFSQRQSAAVAVYRCLGDIIQLERLFGWLEPLATPDECAAWLREAEAAISQ